MRTLCTLALLTSTLTATVAAQVPQIRFGLPDGFDTRPGQEFGGTRLVFDYPYLEYQEVHRVWTGKGTKLLKGMAFRRTWSQVDNPAGTARTAEVTITAGHGNHLKFAAQSFAGNYTSNSATVVHPKAKVSLPSWVKEPVTIPAPFTVVFPFKSAFTYDGISDFVWQLRYENPSVTAETGYRCDGATHSGYVHMWGFPQGTGCTATSRTKPHDLLAIFRNFGPQASATLKMMMTIVTYQNPSSSPVVLALGTKKLDVQIPGWCTRLYPDPQLFIPVGTAGSGGHLQGVDLHHPYTPALEGLTAFVQAYAPDPGLPAGISLTQGVRLRMPPMVLHTLDRRDFRRVYQLSPSAALKGPLLGQAVATGWY